MVRLNELDVVLPFVVRSCHLVQVVLPLLLITEIWFLVWLLVPLLLFLLLLVFDDLNNLLGLWELLLLVLLGLEVLTSDDFLNFIRSTSSLHFDVLGPLQCIGKALLCAGFLIFTQINPLFSCVSFPSAFPHITVRENVYPLFVLLAICPVANISSAIGPHIDTEAILLVVSVLAVVHSAVKPLVGALSVHHVVLPVAAVSSAVRPHVNTIAVDGVVEPVSNVLVAVRPCVHTAAFFFGVNIVTVVFTAIEPGFLALSVLFIVEPEACVLGPVGVSVDTIAVSLVILPFTYNKKRS